MHSVEHRFRREVFDMAIVYMNSPMSDDQRRERLFRGDLFVYGANAATLSLCELAREMSEEAFAPHHPTEAQHHMAVEQYVSILADLKPRFIHHPEAQRRIQAILKAFGCDLEKTYFDVPRLRTMTHGGYLTVGLGTAFPPHRDTWYSHPQCQVIYWMPVYEIDGESGMAFHPKYWNTPVENSSSEFDYQHWESLDRQAAAAQITEERREFSHALEPLDLDDDLRIVSEPGGVTMFAGAQMHSSVPNTSGRTRLSIDIRMLNIDDLVANRGAANVDDASTGTSLMDYRRGTDLEPVPQELVAAAIRD
jgi:hypothetical protein